MEAKGVVSCFSKGWKIVGVFICWSTEGVLWVEWRWCLGLLHFYTGIWVWRFPPSLWAAFPFFSSSRWCGTVHFLFLSTRYLGLVWRFAVLSLIRFLLSELLSVFGLRLRLTAFAV